MAVDSSLHCETWLALDGVITGRVRVGSALASGSTGSAFVGGGAIAIAFGAGMGSVGVSALAKVRGGGAAVGLGGGLGTCIACGE